MACRNLKHLGQHLLLRLALGLDQMQVNSLVIALTVLLLFRLQDIRRALVACEQIHTVLSGYESLECMDTGEQAHEIVLAAECEHGVDQVVTNACFALLDFQAVGKERLK